MLSKVDESVHAVYFSTQYQHATPETCRYSRAVYTEYMWYDCVCYSKIYAHTHTHRTDSICSANNFHLHACVYAVCVCVGRNTKPEDMVRGASTTTVTTHQRRNIRAHKLAPHKIYVCNVYYVYAVLEKSPIQHKLHSLRHMHVQRKKTANRSLASEWPTEIEE